MIVRLSILLILLLLFVGCDSVNMDDNKTTISQESDLDTTLIEIQTTPTPIKPTPTSISTPVIIIPTPIITSTPTPTSTPIRVTPTPMVIATPIVTPTSTPTVIPTPIPTIVVSTNYRTRFINSANCNQIIDKEFLEICYDFNLKVAKSVAYRLEKDLVNLINIEDRPFFYEEEEIDEKYRAKYSDYTNSGYDRGHLAPDAAFDWSDDSLEATYSLANIIPQAPTVNRKMWVQVEKYARDKSQDLVYVDVVNLVKYGNSPTRIGDNKIAVSIGYYKILFNEEEDYEECFYYSNDLDSSSQNDKLSSHKIDCSEID